MADPSELQKTIEKNDSKKQLDEEVEMGKTFQAFNIAKFLMEFVGSFSIVYFGNWAQIFCDLGKSNLVAVAFSVGITYTIFTWMGSRISGAHYNPVTTLSMVFLKKIGWSTAFIYWVFQLLGGMIAGAMIYLQVPPEMFKSLKRLNGLGLPTPDKRYTSESIWTEMIATFFFQFTVMSLFLDKRAPKDVYAIGTGAMMSLGILTIGNVSGGGMNPARAFGPSLITGNLGNDIFIFIGGPVIGSLLAAFLYKEVFIEKKKRRKEDFNDDDAIEEDNDDEDALGGDKDDQDIMDGLEGEDQGLKHDEQENKDRKISKIQAMNKNDQLKAMLTKPIPGLDELVAQKKGGYDE